VKTSGGMGPRWARVAAMPRAAHAGAADLPARLAGLRPGRAALRRAARVTLAGSPGFLFGVLVADDLQLGLFAMIGPVCLGAIAELQGRRAARCATGWTSKRSRAAHGAR
jgi:hypothetical protein